MMRLDAFLWAVRIYKSRSLASKNCKAGKVKLNDEKSKAAKLVSVGDVIEIRIGQINKKIEVVSFPKSRVSAKLVEEFMKDLTPVSEYEKVKISDVHDLKGRVYQGKGRPTKKDRRQIDGIDHD